jgi:hypothetical protein
MNKKAAEMKNEMIQIRSNKLMNASHNVRIFDFTLLSGLLAK